MTSVHVVIAGRVQGVGFRAFVEAEARRHGLAGWVRNRQDGTVEAQLNGSAHDLDRVLDRLRLGPPGARVDTMDTIAAPPGQASGFVVLPDA